MSYLRHFRSCSETKFDALVADGRRCAEIMRREAEKWDPAERAAVEEGRRQARAAPLVVRLMVRLADWLSQRGPRHRPLVDPAAELAVRDRILEHVRTRGVSYDGREEADAKALDTLLHLRGAGHAGDARRGPQFPARRGTLELPNHAPSGARGPR